MSEQRKDTQRFWWRLHKAIALAPEMSGLLLVRYLQQGTPWTEEQKQALRQVVLKQSAALTWQQFAAVDLIDSGGELTDTLVLLESFAIYIDHRLRSFVEDASRTYRERVVGGALYNFPEASSRVWRYLGAANVMTLALMCFLMQWDLRKYRVLLFPLFFLKSYNATLFLFGYIAAPQYPAFLAVALFDYATSFAFWFFSTRAHRAIQSFDDVQLVPQPAPSNATSLSSK